uniref:Uncharacterized protein n=1 Tax=Steinernema glaseri TaxID=37863 RepID=A0A1I7ZV13_9BILA
MRFTKSTMVISQRDGWPGWEYGSQLSHSPEGAASKRRGDKQEAETEGPECHRVFTKAKERDAGYGGFVGDLNWDELTSVDLATLKVDRIHLKAMGIGNRVL